MSSSPHAAGVTNHHLGRPAPKTLLYALRFGRECAEQGLTGITIVNPKGESYDIDRFGMIVSTTDDGLHADRT